MGIFGFDQRELQGSRAPISGFCGRRLTQSWASQPGFFHIDVNHGTRKIFGLQASTKKREIVHVRFWYGNSLKVRMLDWEQGQERHVHGNRTGFFVLTEAQDPEQGKAMWDSLGNGNMSELTSQPGNRNSKSA